LYLTQGTIANPVTIDYVYGEIINDARVKVYPRTISAGNSETLWQLDEPIELSPNEEKRIRANFNEGDKELEIAGRNFQNPVLTFSHPHRWVEQRVELTARSAVIHLTNNSPYDQNLLDAVIYGQKLSSQRVQTVEKSDLDSTMLYGKRSVTIDTGVMNNLDEADALASYESKRKAQPIGIVKSAGIRGGGQFTPTQMLRFTMGTVIAVSDAQLAHNSNYVIVGESHRLSEGLSLHDARYILAPLNQSKVLLLNVDGRNELDGTNVVGY
jgi:hypothetical protein